MKIKQTFLITLFISHLVILLFSCKENEKIAPPVAANFDISMDTVLVGDAVQFNDLSTGDPLAWKWLFGDDNSSNEQNPEHAYNEAGKYDVYLKAISATDSAFILKNEAVTVVDILTTNPMLTDFDLWVDEQIMNVYDNDDYTGISIAFIDQDEVNKFHYGVKKRDTYDLADDKTYYQIASITKPFTSLVVIQWLAENSIALDSSVVSFLPDDCAGGLSLNGKDITFRHLLSHDSGLPAWSYNFSRSDCTFEHGDSTAVYNFLKNNDLPREPGLQTFAYSNLGYAILGLILERQTGNSLKQVFDDYILDELGMSSTVLANPTTLDNVAFTYGGMNSVPDNPCNETFYVVDGAYGAAGGLISNLDDMTRYCQFLLASDNGTGLSAAKNLSFENQYAANNASICLPWFNTTSTSGDLIYDYGGGLSGLNSLIMLNPTKGRAVVFFTNYWISDDDWDQMVDLARNYVDGNSTGGRIELNVSTPRERY